MIRTRFAGSSSDYGIAANNNVGGAPHTAARSQITPIIGWF